MAVPPDLSEIIARLRPRYLKIDRILLDPNNPRLLEARGREEPEESIDETRVQEETFKRLREEKIGRFKGIGDLRASIATAGFLPISTIIVRKHFKCGSKKYVVVEGNRRVAAIMWILREAPPRLAGKELKRRRQQLQKLNVLELKTDEKRLRRDRLLLQGIAHMSPVRIWPAYARAVACHTLHQQGLKSAEISRALGGGIRSDEVGRLLRAFSAYQQMVNDDEFGAVAKEHREYLSWLSEAIGKPKLREWLEWNDKKWIFINDENRRTLYKLFTDEKIGKLTDIRYMPKIIEYAPQTIDRLLTEEEYSIDEAYAEAVRVWQARMAPAARPWRKQIRATIETLEKGVALPFRKKDVELMQNLVRLAQERLKDIERYLWSVRRK
jgi:hypothetical protein